MEYNLPLFTNALECIQNKASRLFPGFHLDPLRHWRDVGGLAIFQQLVTGNFPHMVKPLLPPAIITRTSARLTRNTRARQVPKSRTSSHRDSFIPYFTRLWNALPQSVVDSPSGQGFRRAAHPWLRQHHHPRSWLINKGVSPFGIVGVHIQPERAEVELAEMVAVYDSYKHTFNTHNIIMMGDLNADCGYVSTREFHFHQLRRDPRFKWLIGDDQDTTVTPTNCAYDRIIVAGDELQATVANRSAKVLRFDHEYGLTMEQALAVSDHYPIYATVQ